MNPDLLWEKYKDAMSMDFVHNRVHENPARPDRTVLPADHNYALLDLERRLQAFPKNHTTDYHLPAPTTPVPTDVDAGTGPVASEIRDALTFDRDVETQKIEVLLGKFNEEQRRAFGSINASVLDGAGQCFFLDGAGGCGKTTVAKGLIHAARSRGQIALACASSGIAATLLPKGQTAHSAFKIPIENLNPDSTCHIGGRSGKAALMRQIALVVWDEAFMVHRYGFEAVARMFRDLRNNRESAFGGVTMLILGDLRQTLPVMPRGSRVQIVNSCFTKSKLWTAFKRTTLQKHESFVRKRWES